jgi:hypothetical protein
MVGNFCEAAIVIEESEKEQEAQDMISDRKVTWHLITPYTIKLRERELDIVMTDSALYIEQTRGCHKVLTNNTKSLGIIKCLKLALWPD